MHCSGIETWLEHAKQSQIILDWQKDLAKVQLSEAAPMQTLSESLSKTPTASQFAVGIWAAMARELLSRPTSGDVKQLQADIKHFEGFMKQTLKLSKKDVPSYLNMQIERLKQKVSGKK